MRRRAARYLLYAVASGVLPVSLLAAVMADGGSHPLVTTREILYGLVSGLVALGCLARAAGLGLTAAGFESLNRSESQDLERWLCPGMIRSDIVDELSRHGWRIGKIRSVLSGLTPVRRDAA